MSVSAVVWVLVVAPIVVALQVGLIALRNHVRRWIHRPREAPASAPVPATPDPLASVIQQELDAVFGAHFVRRHDGLADHDMRRLADQLSGTVAARVARRVPLTGPELRTLQRALPTTIREVLALTPEGASYSP